MYTHIVQILDWDFYIRSIGGYYLKFGDISAVQNADKNILDT